MDHASKGRLKSHKNIAVQVETDETRSFYHDKKRQIWLWRAVGRRSGEAGAFWLEARGRKRLDKSPEPLGLGSVYNDVGYACCERFSPGGSDCHEKNTQKIEREHPPPRTWITRLARKGLRFSKTERTRKIVACLAINVWFWGRLCLLQYF